MVAARTAIAVAGAVVSNPIANNTTCRPVPSRNSSLATLQASSGEWITRILPP